NLRGRLHMASKKTKPTAAEASEHAVATAAAKPGRPAKKMRQAAKTKSKDAAPSKLSALDAAAKILEESGQAMNCQAMIQEMAAKVYWTPPNGKPPAATLYSALLREIKLKGKQSRFQKTARGQFIYHAPQAS